MFKALAIAMISSVGLVSISTTSVGAETTQNLNENRVTQNYSVSPQQLLKLARQGRFKEKGIPSYSRLNSAIKSGKVTAQSLVSAAIATKRLPQSTLEDANYLSAIDKHLKSGGCSSQ